MTQAYDVTKITVRPGTHPQALAVLGKSLAADPTLLACWYSDIGAVNQILILRNAADPAVAIDNRYAVQNSANPLGIADLIVDMSMDTYMSFDFIAPMRAGDFGPCFEVRSYVLKPGALPAVVEAWRSAVPGRMKISPVLAVMSSVSGTMARLMHIWPYKSFDERARLREKAVAEGVWPPSGGPGLLVSQQVDIYLPAPFSPMK